MKKGAVIVGLVFLSLAAIAGCQIASCYIANAELQSDMKDLAVQSPGRIGLADVSSEEDLRDAVISHGKEYGIHLTPEQVRVQRKFVPGMLQISIAANYEARVDMPGFSFTIHFTPSSSHSGEVVAK